MFTFSLDFIIFLLLMIIMIIITLLKLTGVHFRHLPPKNPNWDTHFSGGYVGVHSLYCNHGKWFWKSFAWCHHQFIERRFQSTTRCVGKMWVTFIHKTCCLFFFWKLTLLFYVFYVLFYVFSWNYLFLYENDRLLIFCHFHKEKA